jgi:hypothetical protein
MKRSAMSELQFLTIAYISFPLLTKWQANICNGKGDRKMRRIGNIFYKRNGV